MKYLVIIIFVIMLIFLHYVHFLTIVFCIDRSFYILIFLHIYYNIFTLQNLY